MLLISGCEKDSVLLENPSKPSLTPTNWNIISTTKPPSFSDTLGATLTSVAVQSSTFTPTPDETWTPYPTLSNSASEKLVLGLLEDNGGCNLPCWWGIKPGVTSWVEAQHFFATFATSIEQGGSREVVENGSTYQVTNYTIQYKISGVPEGGGAMFSISNGIVSKINVGSDSTKQRFQLHQLLSDYGQPEKVFIKTFQDAPGYPPPFDLVLYYPRFNFLAFFETDAEKMGDVLNGCPQSVTPGLRLWDANWVITDESIKSMTIGGDPSDWQLRNLGEVTDMTIKDFYQTYKVPESKVCIETPAKYWP
jgi:hypothetical protein